MDKRTLNRKEFANKIDRSERTVQYWKSKGYISDYTVEELNRIKEKQYEFFTDGGKIKPLMQDEKERIYTLEFFTGGVSSIIHKWLVLDCVTEIEELIEIIKKCIDYKI